MYKQEQHVEDERFWISFSYSQTSGYYLQVIKN